MFSSALRTTDFTSSLVFHILGLLMWESGTFHLLISFLFLFLSFHTTTVTHIDARITQSAVDLFSLKKRTIFWVTISVSAPCWWIYFFCCFKSVLLAKFRMKTLFWPFRCIRWLFFFLLEIDFQALSCSLYPFRLSLILPCGILSSLWFLFSFSLLPFNPFCILFWCHIGFCHVLMIMSMVE